MNSETWLTEEVECKGGYTMTRRKAIWLFTKNYLVSFLSSHGYTVYPTPKEFSCGIATLLFQHRKHTLIGPFQFERQNDYSIEHKEHFNHKIDYKAWETFWKDYGFWEDVDINSFYGFYRRLDIQEYCWSQLDLSCSRQTAIVEDHINGTIIEDGHIVYREDFDEY